MNKQLYQRIYIQRYYKDLKGILRTKKSILTFLTLLMRRRVLFQIKNNNIIIDKRKEIDIKSTPKKIQSQNSERYKGFLNQYKNIQKYRYLYSKYFIMILSYFRNIKYLMR